MGCNSSVQESNEVQKKNLPRCIFISGAPGSGKRTQCKKIVEKYGFKFISCGNLLRDEAKSGSAEGEKIKAIQEAGKLVPSETVVKLVQAQITNSKDIYLIEGFPKNMENIETWNKVCGKDLNVLKMFYFHCQTHILQERLKNRQQNSGRSDDAPEVVSKRLETYKDETRVIVQHFDKLQKCVHVNSERSPEAVFKQICEQVDYMLNKKEVRLPEIIFISGQLASGKRSQAWKIKEKYNYDVLVTNEVLKEAAEKGDERGNQIKELMSSGQYVSSEMVVQLIIQKIDSLNNRYFVIEGFPKNQDNIDTWNRKTVGVFHTKLFLFFDVDKKVALERLQERSKSSDKPEDQMAVIEKRINNFEKNSSAVVKYFESVRKLARIDCNRPMDSVFRQVCLKIDEQLYYQKIELPRVLFICGGPGAGKGTQCAKMKETFNFQHYSTGDLLRAEVASGSALAAQIKEVQDQGKLVSSDLLVDIVKAQLEYKTGVFMLDGFPRSQENIDVWEKKMNGVCTVDYLIYFECEQSAMEARMLERSKTSGRSDDNPETIAKRLVTFFEQTKPIVQHFKKQNKLISINADRDIDPIFASVQEAVNTKILVKNASLPDVYFVNGGPGVGKRTLCHTLAEKNGFVHLNVGELLKAKSASSCSVGKSIKAQIANGHLVTSETVVNLLKEKIGNKGGKFLVDGFPKSFENLDQWNISMLYNCNLGPTILLECDEEVVFQRSKAANGGEEDQELLRRLTIFKTQTLRLIPGFEKHGNLKRVNVTGLSQEQVYEQVVKLLV